MKRDINLQKKILEYIEENGRMPQAKKSLALYQKWRTSNERFILENMKDKELSEIPEEYREFIEKMREYGYGVEENIQKEILKDIEKNGKLPTMKQKNEKELYQKWWLSDEKSVLKICEGEPIEKVPEKYRDFVEKIREYDKSIGDEILEFIENKKRLPDGTVKEEWALYKKLWRSSEKRALDIFNGKPIEDVPEKYRKFVKKMRDYGLEKKGKVRSKSDPEIQKEILEFIGKNGIMPHDGESSVLYQKWLISNERFILENMKDKELSEIPEEYRKFIKKMREYGYGLNEKIFQKEMLKFIEENGKLPNASNSGNEEELYYKWRLSNEKIALEIFEGKPIEDVPEKYRKFVEKMREYGYGIKKKTIGDEILEFIENKKRLPNAFVKEECRLYARWRKSSEKRALEIFEGKPIEDVPEKYREFVKEMRNYKETIKTSKKQRKIKRSFDSGKIQFNKRYKVKNESVQKEILEYIKENGKLPTTRHKNGKKLYQKWWLSDEKSVLKICEGEPIEKVPEKYRDFVEKMREYGYGIKKKTIGDEMLEFIENRKRMPKDFVEEEKNLYARWMVSSEKRALDIFNGKPIEDVPEKYRRFVEKMRNYGLEESNKVRSKSDPEIQKEILKFIEKNGIMPHDG